MYDLTHINDDNYYKLFYTLNIKNSSFLTKYNNYIQDNLRNKNYNNYFVNNIQKLKLEIMLCNYLYYFKNTKFIILNDNMDINFIENKNIECLDKYFNINYLFDKNDYICNDVDILITNYNNFYQYLINNIHNYNFINRNYNYIFFINFKKGQNILHNINSIQNVFNIKQLNVYFSLYSENLNKNYKYVKDNIHVYNYINKKCKNNLHYISNYLSIHEKITHLLSYTSIGNAFIFIKKENLDILIEYLIKYDITYYKDYEDFSMNYNNISEKLFFNNGSCKFFIFTNEKILKQKSYFLNNIIFYDYLDCINAYNDFFYYTENKQNIYFLNYNQDFFDDVKKFYNIKINII